MIRSLSLLTVLAATPVLAQPAQGIETVISDQIDAFIGNDVSQAFAYAAPGIQQMFGTPERFGAMVRDGYPMVWRPADVTYLGRTEDGAATVQRVMIRDGAGDVHFLAYRMIRLDGHWRISGVQLLQAGVGL